MIVSHRVALVAATELLIEANRDRLNRIYAELANAEDAADVETATLLRAECAAHAAFITKLVDLLEEQKAAVRRATT